LDLKTTAPEPEEDIPSETSMEKAVDNFVEHLEQKQAQTM